MKLGKKILIFLNSIHFFLFCASAEKPGLSVPRIEIKPVTYVPRPLLIFLDDGEKDVGSVTVALITALSQGACPILVSGHVLRNLFANYKDPTSQPSDIAKLQSQLSDIRRKYSKTQLKETQEDIQKEKDIFAKLLFYEQNFRKFPNDWIIKQVFDNASSYKNSLYLLIPHNYLQELKIDLKDVEYFGTSTISSAELSLGLKVNHMPTVILSDVLRVTESYRDISYFIASILDSSKRSRIFCTRDEYSNANIATMPSWAFYMLGHGSMGSSIVGISLEGFKVFLEFLENRVATTLLIYSSCYAAGTNEELIYKDVQAPIGKKTFPFAIITEAITDSIIEKFSVSIIGLDIFSSSYHFNVFTKKVMQSDIFNYEKLAKSVLFSVPSAKEISWGNVAQIKLPGLEWFSVLTSQKEVVSIGSTLAKTRDPEKPLNIQTFFKTDPRALLLHAHTIPFELIINSLRFDVIISMIPGKAVHKIKAISSTRPFNEVLDWFMKLEQLDVLKFFFIEKIGSKENIIIYNEREEIFDEYLNYALFYEGGKLYRKEPKQEPREAKKEDYENYKVFDDEIKDYLKSIEKKEGGLAQEKIQEIKRVTEKKAKEIREKQQALPNLRSSLIKLEHSLEQLQLYLQQLQQH